MSGGSGPTQSPPVATPLNISVVSLHVILFIKLIISFIYSIINCSMRLHYSMFILSFFGLVSNLYVTSWFKVPKLEGRFVVMYT